VKLKRLIAVLTCTASSATFATDEITDEEIVVTATRIPQSLGQSLASVTVIRQADIQASHAPDVATILRGVAGVELSQNGGLGKTASLFLRGSSATQVLVLIDGVRMNSATTGTTAIQDLMLDQVERIEIVRGNVSSVYGSEAIGGVVQIFTKKGRGAPQPNASVQAGSQRTHRLSGGFGGAVGSTDFHMQLSSFKTNGVSAIDPALNAKANPDTDGYRNTSVSANVRHALNADHSVSGSFFNSQGDNQYDNAFGPATAANTNKQKLNKVSLSVDDRLSDAWRSHLQYAQGVDEYRDYKNGVPTTSSLYRTTNRQLGWQNTVQSSSGQLLLGAERLVQNVDANVVYTLRQRTVNSLFAGYSGNYGANQVQVNMRQDNNSQYGAERTGLLGYGFAFDEAWRATASYSSAFRAPTFNELYYPSFGNPAIKPEHSRNLEAGVHYVAGGHQVDAVYFDNRVRDLIVYAPNPVNLNRARINGMELNYAGQFGNTGVKVALTPQDPRDEATGQLLVRRARFHGSLMLTQRIGDWRLGGEWLYSGQRQDSYTDPNTFVTARKTLAAYNVFNLTSTYAISKELKLALRVDNLTNQNDSTVYSFNPLGRRGYIGLDYQP
jgi:vitamin B12 transporter